MRVFTRSIAVNVTQKDHPRRRAPYDPPVRAVVLQGNRQVAVEQVPDPELPGPDGAVVAIERTAICGSDLHLYHAEPGTAGVRLGHEFVGSIAEVGSEVRNLKPGDRVLVSAVIACGRCTACLARDPILCFNGGPKVFGTGLDLHGGQAEAAAFPAADAFALRIPDEVSVDQSVLLTDILPTGYTGAQRADIRPGSTAAVIGLGPVGTFALQSAQLFGPSRVFGVDVVPERLARAEQLGAEPVDVSDGNTVQRLLEATKGRGVDSVIEAVGSDRTILAALLSTAPGGTVSVIGVNNNLRMPIPMPLLLQRRLTFRVTLVSVPSTWNTLIPLIAAGRLHPEDVFTHRMGLADAADAYRLFDAREDGVLKVLLDPAR